MNDIGSWHVSNSDLIDQVVPEHQSRYRQVSNLHFNGRSNVNRCCFGGIGKHKMNEETGEADRLECPWSMSRDRGF